MVTPFTIKHVCNRPKPSHPPATARLVRIDVTPLRARHRLVTAQYIGLTCVPSCRCVCRAMAVSDATLGCAEIVFASGDPRYDFSGLVTLAVTHVASSPPETATLSAITLPPLTPERIHGGVWSTCRCTASVAAAKKSTVAHTPLCL